jgi:hypothetical protein
VEPTPLRGRDGPPLHLAGAFLPKAQEVTVTTAAIILVLLVLLAVVSKL